MAVAAEGSASQHHIYLAGALFDDRLLLNTCKIELRTAIKKTYPQNHVKNLAKPYNLPGGGSGGTPAKLDDAAEKKADTH